MEEGLFKCGNCKRIAPLDAPQADPGDPLACPDCGLRFDYEEEALPINTDN